MSSEPQFPDVATAADDADRLHDISLEGVHSRVRVLHARLTRETRPRRT